MKIVRVLFMGRKPVAAKCLEYLLSNHRVEVVGVLTDSHLKVSPTSDVARDNNLRLFTFEEALAAMKSGTLIFDIGFSILFWRKLRDEFLKVPSRGIVNFHPAILPDYKGTAGYNLAILDGLDEWGVSAHYIDQDIDTGDIIEVKKFPISNEYETAKSLENRSQEVLLQQFMRVADLALDVSYRLPTSPNQGGRYITRNEMEAMKEVMPSDDVSRKIRAFWFPPYDGAFIMVNGVKCTLVDRTILDGLADTTSSSLFTAKADEQ